MPSPDDRRYSSSHEWHRLEADGTVTIGLTRFAVDELTDITYLEITRTDGPIKAGEAFGEIESVKTTSELYCGIDGTIVAVNQKVLDSPGIINDDPFDAGWLIKVRPADPAQLDSLMDAAAYDQSTGR